MVASAFMSLVSDVARATGSPVLDENLTRVSGELERSNMSDDSYVPSFFFDALRRMLARETTPWVVLPPSETGLGWALGEVTSAVPDAWFDELPDRDVLGVPALRRAVVVARDGGRDRYAVVELHASGRPLEPPPRSGPTILGTFTPTDDQVRRWAYDPDMYFTTQEEELAYDSAPVPLLIQLARDPACPKRKYARSAILDQGLRRVLVDGEAALPHMAEVERLLRTSGDTELYSDGVEVRTLREYLVGEGPVELSTARSIAHLLLAGVADVIVDFLELDGWWELTVRNRASAWLYVQGATGALVYRSVEPLDVPRLAALGTPRVRASALGRSPRLR